MSWERLLQTHTAPFSIIHTGFTWVRVRERQVADAAFLTTNRHPINTFTVKTLIIYLIMMFRIHQNSPPSQWASHPEDTPAERQVEPGSIQISEDLIYDCPSADCTASETLSTSHTNPHLKRCHFYINSTADSTLLWRMYLPQCKAKRSVVQMDLGQVSETCWFKTNKMPNSKSDLTSFNHVHLSLVHLTQHNNNMYRSGLTSRI